MDAAQGLVQFGLDAGRTGRVGDAGQAVNRAARMGNHQAAREAAESFEAMFIASMLEHIGRDVTTGEGYFGGGQGEAMFQSLLNEEYAREIVKGGGIGVADSVMSFILKLQEV